MADAFREMVLPEVDVRQVTGRKGAARRRRERIESASGRHTRSERWSRERRGAVAVDATLRAAARRAAVQREAARLVTLQDVRVKVRTRPRSPLIVLVVDCSESMQARARLAVAWQVALRLLARAYLTRDRVAVIAFGGERAWMVAPPTSSVMLARDGMKKLRASGATPLAAGLLMAQRTIANERGRDPGAHAVMVLLSDGEANVPLRPGPWLMQELAQQAAKLRQLGVRSIVVDTNPAREASPLLKRLAGWLGAGPLLHSPGLPRCPRICTA